MKLRLLLCCLLIAMAGCQRGVDRSTPQAAYDSLFQALLHKNWEQIAQLTTEDARRNLLILGPVTRTRNEMLADWQRWATEHSDSNAKVSGGQGHYEVYFKDDDLYFHIGYVAKRGWVATSIGGPPTYCPHPSFR